MNYNLLVFEVDRAPQQREAFVQWWKSMAEWSEDHDYDDPQFATPRLQAWFKDMISAFPAMNGLYGVEDDDDVFDDPRVTDYCIAATAIYASFSWSEAEAAHELSFETAKAHGLGFYDVSDDLGRVWQPDGKGGYAVVHREADAATTSPPSEPVWERLKRALPWPFAR